MYAAADKEFVFFENHPFRDLLGNYLEFLETHRARVENDHDGILVTSDKEEFTFAIPGENGVSLNLFQQFNRIHFIRNGNGRNYFSSFRFERTGSLSFMLMQEGFSEWKVNDSVIIRRVRSESGFEDFSMVQGKVFTTSDEEFNEWYPWLRAANFRNIGCPDQFFFVAYERSRPVAVALMVRTGEVAGMYAVGTLPAHRNKGIATALLKKAACEGFRSGCSGITLQVATFSPAHEFYKGVGFADAFEMEIYTR